MTYIQEKTESQEKVMLYPSPVPMISLLAKPVVEQLEATLKEYFSQPRFEEHYLVNLRLNESAASETYVTMKQKKAAALGIDMYILPTPHAHTVPEHLFTQMDGDTYSLEEVLALIDSLNGDAKCIGMLVQLPLPVHLQPHQAEILAAIAPNKDIDGLGGVMLGLGMIGARDFLPATPQAVFHLLEHYELADVSGKICIVLGQSNLIGKPLAAALITRGATVISVNNLSNPDRIKARCLDADYIFSATGQVHLITPDHVRPDGSQVVIDIGRGVQDGKAVGDVDPAVGEWVKALSPVP